MSKRVAMFVVALIGLLLAVAACAQRYRNAAHPEYGKSDYDRDWYECQRDTSRPHTTAGIGTMYGETVMATDYSMARACMRTRGWQLAE